MTVDRSDDQDESSKVLNILVDADVLVALSKTNDSNHKKATVLNDLLLEIGATYYFSPFTIAEAATVLSYKTTHQAATKFMKQIRKLNIPTIELDEKMKLLPDQWFLKQRKKGTSYFDCYNMALLDKYNKQLLAIFSFDSIYKRNGFILVQDLKF
ncbi:hypothetical protein A2W14_04655 [Candidatus Gottesmanbacteria bacterium RBG_16_37_8]|uniref:PIN domain-containing protein n=1 Tax=Candidatus Gottesmanbacteria bacterium RBG_16_37_8 TaxID=1798371 RepID=A0A1F5YSQ2_9BACT|nr:MAG: hypothetical protein A2W14_04655 [Candidatus Gottesmanbacteria bacterium RBG_16_37_8]